MTTAVLLGMATWVGGFAGRTTGLNPLEGFFFWGPVMTLSSLVGCLAGLMSGPGYAPSSWQGWKSSGFGLTSELELAKAPKSG